MCVCSLRGSSAVRDGVRKSPKTRGRVRVIAQICIFDRTCLARKCGEQV